MAWHPARGNISLLMTPGPVECSPRVLEALSRPQAYHYYPGFISFFQETVEKTRRLFQTKNDVLILQGEGVLGLEGAVANTINRGDKVLVCDSGPFGKWFSVWVKNSGGVPIEVSVPSNEAIEPEAVKAELDTEKDIRLLTVVHCETPTGILNPVKEICLAAKKHGVLTVVDAVASLAGVDVKPEAWGIDMCVSATQKCVGAPPSLTLMSVSKNAWEAVEKKKRPIRNSYLSLLDWKNTWIKEKTFPFTPFTTEIFGLHEALSEILEEGLSKVFNRHHRVAKMCRREARRLGLELWPKNEDDASDTVTAIKVPEVIGDRVVSHMAKEHGILIGGGYRETKGKVLRIGHMGYQAKEANIAATINALELTLKSLKER
jgi:pyridoxamine--pyruvate transaminase